MGRKKRPVFAIVAADSRSPRDGRYIEDLGRYDSLQEPSTVSINAERALYWLETGAQPSDTVRSLLSREGVMLALHMRRKGASEEDIASAVEAHREKRAEKVAASVKMTSDQKRQLAMKEEETRATARAADLAKKRSAAAAKAKENAEAAIKAADENRAAAAEEAKTEQAEANVAQAEADAPADAPAAEEAPAKEAEAPAAEEAPAEEAAPEAEASAEEDGDSKKDS